MTRVTRQADLGTIIQHSLRRSMALERTIQTLPNGGPFNTAFPILSGSPVVGAVLSVTTGSWLGAPTFTYAWKYLDTGGAVPGAGALSTYTIVIGDRGHKIVAIVTATNAIDVVPQSTSPTIVIT